MKQLNAKWYVYELVNPIDGKTFYVGKGSGNRVHQHEKDARKGVCSKKCNKIKYIWSQGFEILKRENAVFWDEQAAYDHETDLISEIGLSNLTNIMPGGQGAFERRVTERNTRREKPPQPLHLYIEKTEPQSPLFQRFAEWFRAGLHNGGQIIATTTDPRYQFHCAITEASYNHILPMFWRIIQKDQKSLDSFIEKMKYHKVEISYGCA